MSFPFRIILTVLPVITFLVSLVFLDSYKLVRLPAVLLALLLGCGAAFASLFVNVRLMEFVQWDYVTYARSLGPVVEEILKAAYLVFLVRSKRVAFPVDAAILGFTIGAGFAVVENVYFLNACPLSPFACALRGFGTAVMHGGATALFGIVALSLSERYVTTGWKALVPALGIAFLVHSLFNILLVSPALTVVGLVIVLPLVFLIAFHQSEKTLRNWIGVGLDTDADLLAIINKGGISDSNIGKYISSLKEHFPPEVVVDMLCLLRLHAELSIKAKGTLLMKEAGFEVPHDPEAIAKLEELKFLERSIGKTGMLAMAPFLRWRTRDLWQLHMIGMK
jgi:RsiW-degrading membrane proteinase PrsW (M82 family)